MQNVKKIRVTVLLARIIILVTTLTALVIVRHAHHQVAVQAAHHPAAHHPAARLQVALAVQRCHLKIIATKIRVIALLAQVIHQLHANRVLQAAHHQAALAVHLPVALAVHPTTLAVRADAIRVVKIQG